VVQPVRRQLHFQNIEFRCDYLEVRSSGAIEPAPWFQKGRLQGICRAPPGGGIHRWGETSCPDGQVIIDRQYVTPGGGADAPQCSHYSTDDYQVSNTPNNKGYPSYQFSNGLDWSGKDSVEGEPGQGQGGTPSQPPKICFKK